MDVAQAAPNTVWIAEDEASLYLQATTCHVFAPKGQTPMVRADPGRAKTNFHGAPNLLDGTETAMRSDSMNAEVSAQFLSTLLKTNPDMPLVVLWDRALWHRGQPTSNLLQENS